MPGIIPMKLIKCGSSQTRIAQACDRCRSKKIRCDGVRPCCSQCANVGFECKTSDKLSRRAFPRGYTESLEERVRCLEREVRELKDLLDAKDEQLDMLSRIHSFSPYSPPASATSGIASNKSRKSPDVGYRRSQSVDDDGPPEEMIVVGESAGLIRAEPDSDGIYMGASSGRPFVDAFKQMMSETGRSPVEFQSDKFFQGSNELSSETTAASVEGIKSPPRLLSDHLLVSYFQEYHPLFPVLHRPTFLALYERLVSGDTDTIASLSKHAIAQLFLVFSIALQQSEPRSTPDRRLFDGQWQAALNCVLSESSISTLQCLVLAQLYCAARGEHNRLLHYKSIAASITMRLGLNHSQRKFSLGALAGEMRKRAFWCVYCLDTFSAATLGLPRLLKDEGVETEYPSDIDDEYVSEDGFLPTLPGDSTKISSALALFRLSRILAAVLDTVYPSSLSHELSYSKFKELEEDADRWKSSLAPHLRLEFANGTPATNIVHSRSPLLVMAYHYIRMLIHRPVVSSSFINHSSASLLTIRESSKCIIQIVQLLTERKLGFSFCLNKAQLLLQSGFGILYSAAISPPDGVLAKENQRLISAILEELQRASPPALLCELGIAVGSVFSMPQKPDIPAVDVVRAHSPISPPCSSGSSVQQPEMHSIRRKISAVSAKLLKSPGSSRRTNLQDFENGRPVINTSRRLTSASLTDLSPPSRSRSLYPLQQHLQPRPIAKPESSRSRHSVSYEPTALDYMWSLGVSGSDTARQPQQGRPSTSEAARNAAVSTDDWENMLAMMDASHAAHIYGDGGSTLIPSPTHTGDSSGQSPDMHWGIGAGRGFHNTPSLSSFSTLSDGSEDNGAVAPYQERDERIGEYMGSMIGEGGEGVAQAPGNGAAPLLVEEGWAFEN